jgi:hypothetical protein
VPLTLFDEFDCLCAAEESQLHYCTGRISIVPPTQGLEKRDVKKQKTLFVPGFLALSVLPHVFW